MPSGAGIRPTSDKVKQALFNILGARVENASFLDLFAGAGAVGIEALSRGARSVVFVEAARLALNVIQRNIDATGLKDRARIVKSSVEAFLKKEWGPFDIVFLDPPYAKELTPLLEGISEAGFLHHESVVIAEHFKKQPSPAYAGRLALFREARYGDTVLAFYKL